MKQLQPLLTALGQLGVSIPPAWLAVGAALLTVLGIVVAWVVARRKKAAGSEKGPAVEKGSASLTPAPTAYPLRQAWNRFMAGLPALYRRSILGFDQYVVLGAEASGKTRLIDTNTDWQRQAKQLTGSQSSDPDLQVYLTSEAVVMEIPARVTLDTSNRSRSALTRLWKPLYGRRRPVVVLALDAPRLQRQNSDAIKDLAETLRGKINLIGSLRREPLEVRLALTHLDEMVGYQEFARFCQTQGISSRIPVPSKGGEAALERWLESARGHLPRALLSQTSADYRKIVGFLRAAPELLPPVGRFLDILFRHEALFPDPTPGGVYLTSDPAGVPSPFAIPAKAAPAPDPRRRHLIGTAAAAAIILTYFVGAYAAQRARWVGAARAMDGYRASTYGSEGEEVARTAICEFTIRSNGFVQKYPDFFSGARTKMRAKFSAEIRDGLLLPRLREVAQRGTLKEGETPLQSRRSLYFLALIHSDSSDAMEIQRADRIDVWSLMTDLHNRIIREYLRNTDEPFTRPVRLDFDDSKFEHDSTSAWLEFLRRTEEVLAAGWLRPEDLRTLQHSAVQLGDDLRRFEHDDVTRTILDRLDDAAGTASQRGAERPLKDAYSPKFERFLQGASQSDLFVQREAFRTIAQAVQGSSIEPKETTGLKALGDRLDLLEATKEQPAEGGEVKLKVAAQEFTFDPAKWAKVIGNSEIIAQIHAFLRAKDPSIFFTPQVDEELRPLEWNPRNDGHAIFVGKASIQGRYRAASYEKYVRAPVTQVTAALAKAPIPEDDKRQLEDAVREEVRHYAGEYAIETARYYHAFGLNAPSPEAIRVALAQMVSESSPFADFLTAIDRNVTVQTDDPMLAPMADALAQFSVFHTVVDASAGSPELAKYKAILSQLLADIGPVDTGVDLGAEPPAHAVMTLEKELSPLGRVALRILRGDKSYAALVSQWLESVKLPPSQQAPFLAPVEQVLVSGRREIQRILDTEWCEHMLPDAQRVVSRFPFNQESNEDATPQELSEILNPQTGTFFDMFRRYFEPLSEFPEKGGFRERPSARASLPLPPEIYTVAKAVAFASARLWDPSGRPIPIPLRVAPVPFEHGINPRAALTLVYLNVGDASVFDFNQKPGLSSIPLDWSKETNSQVGIQLTDLDTKENSFPEPIAVQGSHWSFLRLLKRAESAPVKEPANSMLYTWAVAHRPGGTETTNARFVVTGDPWSSFALGNVVRAASCGRSN